MRGQYLVTADIELSEGCLGAIGVGVMIFGARLEGSHRWRPTSYLMQTAGLSFLLSTAIYSKQAWDDVCARGRRGQSVILVPARVRRVGARLEESLGPLCRTRG